MQVQRTLRTQDDAEHGDQPFPRTAGRLREWLRRSSVGFGRSGGERPRGDAFGRYGQGRRRSSE